MFNNNLNEPSDDKQTAIEHEYIILYYITLFTNRISGSNRCN